MRAVHPKMCVWSARQTSLKMGRQIRSRWRSPVDFRNLSYFHREFKKKYGMTPKRFISLSARAADFHEIVNNYHFYDS